MDDRSAVQRYRVGSSASSNVSVYHLKLTDASSKALEEFQKSKNQSKGQFRIKISNNHGEAHVPTVTGTRQFKFSISGIAMDPLSSFECLSESKKKMVAIGSLSKKLTVHATDDVYKATKEKMALAEEESKRNCIKVIKQGASGEAPFVRKPSKPSSFAPSSKPSRPTFPGKTQRESAKQGFKNNSPSTSSRSGSQAEPRRVSSPVETRPSLTSNSLSSGNSAAAAVRPLGNSSIINYPYRDRIIHLLAVRSYKKLELQQILERDGASDREKQSWTSVLNQVAIFSHHDNSYSLSPSYYNDVKEDWPFYAEDTRREVIRKLSHIKEGLRPTSVSPLSSPSSAASSVNSPTEAVKRFAPDDQYSVPSKRQRVAHAQRASTTLEVAQSSASQTASARADGATGAALVETKPAKSERKAFSVQEFEGQENVDISKDDSSYLRDYVPIMSVEQRRSYKADFYKEYDEYQMLYKQISQRTDIFKKLNGVFESSHGLHRETIRDQIFSEYDKLQEDEMYAAQKRRYVLLETKLRHIKKLVQEFDGKQLNPVS